MALENIPTIGPGALNANLDKVVVYKNGGSEAAVSLLTLTNSALSLSGVYLDSVNGRVGINNPTPVTALDVIGAGRFYQAFGIGVPSLFAYNGRAEADSTLRLDNAGSGKLYYGGVGLLTEGNATFGQLTSLGARVGIKGSGSTSATTSLLVQNSAGTTAFQVKDDLNANFQGRIQIEYDKISFLGNPSNTYIQQNIGIGYMYYSSAQSHQIMINAQPKIIVKDTGASQASTLIVGHNVATSAIADASALLEVRSDATYLRGFLKPKMTTAQKNAIVTPAAGLEVYDTDLNRPCFYNGTSWITL